MERKLATVLFVDIVDSTSFVAAADPEVVRRRVNEFFREVSACVHRHGGIVEKFAGDAVLAAFGIPQAHEDDAERAVRAALAIMGKVTELGLEARIGLESGEVVVDEAESTFATGEAVNLAARLQQAASPGEILIGPAAQRLSLDRIEVEDAGPLELRGVAAPLRVWRVLCAPAVPHTRARAMVRANMIGRESELELLENTFARAVRDGRAHLFTIFGEPGVGKSRLAREFLESVERATILTGRCLPYGEGITYWPLAEMVKQAAGITDDDPPEVAFEKLQACCEEAAVADLLALAAGLLEALDGERSGEEITWAAREFAQKLGEASGQPVILAFEDIHWAEEPLLELIEHLSDWLRAPVLLLCLARPELLDHRPGWGGGRVRATAIELEPLHEDESRELISELLDRAALAPDLVERVASAAEGNPLFVEETIRMLVEEPAAHDRAERIPDTLQALIAARIDGLPALEKALLQRAAVMGRIFYEGALAALSTDVDDLADALDDLLQREFLLVEDRSSLSGERSYRFKHVLIREVAYSGLSKSARADYHRKYAEWLRERASDDLLEIRAYHLEQATELLAELDGQPPEDLAKEAAETLTLAGRRAIAREAFGAARKLLVRALELEPSLKRRYLAARASWRLGDYATVAIELEKVRVEAAERGESSLEARALTGLSAAALAIEGDSARSQELAEAALALLEGDSDSDAQFDALVARANVSAWRGEAKEMTRYFELAFTVALAAGRKDLQTIAAQALAQARIYQLELDEAEPLLAKAVELAEESGSVRAAMSAKLATASLHQLKGELDEAEELYEELHTLATEIGNQMTVGHVLTKKALIAMERSEPKRAEKLFREAVRVFTQLGARTNQATTRSGHAWALSELGKVEEAERVVAEAQLDDASDDPEARAILPLGVAAVRMAQGRDDEAEDLIRTALSEAEQTAFCVLQLAPLRVLIRFLRERGREDEAAPYEERLAELAPALSTA